MRTIRRTARPRTRTVGAHDFYPLYDGNRATYTALMLPAGTRVRRLEVG